MTFLDIFAGIGGFRLGMEQAGHKCIGFIELDKYAVASYRAMHNTEGEFYADDIRRVWADELPCADCWCFGFPCQDISIAGKQAGLTGNRSGLFYAVTRLIRDLPEENRPANLIIENVKNLLSINGGFDFARVLIELDEIGYDAEWQVLNTAWYLPQNRERIYIIGHLRGRSTRKVFPVAGESAVDLKQIIGGRQSERVYSTSGLSCTISSQGGGMGQKTGLYLIDLSRDHPKITKNARCITSRYHKGVANRAREVSGILTVCNVNPSGKGINGNVYSVNGIAPALTTNKGEGRKVFINNGKCYAIRRLTPLECFRLQGFSDALFYKAQAVNSDTQLYKQAGNSVSVPVIYEIAKQLTDRSVYGEL